MEISPPNYRGPLPEIGTPLSHRLHRVYGTVVAVEPAIGGVTRTHTYGVCTTCYTCVVPFVYVF